MNRKAISKKRNINYKGENIHESNKRKESVESHHCQRPEWIREGLSNYNVYSGSIHRYNNDRFILWLFSLKRNDIIWICL